MKNKIFYELLEKKVSKEYNTNKELRNLNKKLQLPKQVKQTRPRSMKQ